MTPAEAADSVIATIEPQWDRGTLTAAAVYEDATHFAVSYGNREYIVGANPRYMVLDLPLGFVEKATGAITFRPYLANQKRVDAMAETVLARWDWE